MWVRPSEIFEREAIGLVDRSRSIEIPPSGFSGSSPGCEADPPIRLFPKTSSHLRPTGRVFATFHFLRAR